MNNTSRSAPGTLYIVATPIGNLDDISNRAIAILNQVDGILAEDTRHSRPLLTAYGIRKPLFSFHAHNEAKKSGQIISALLNARSFALISDAGTPLISDPGFILVREARQAGIPIVPIPGPCAFITALCASGIPCDNFLFGGFLPARPKARQTKLASFPHDYTLIFYESTHRIAACIEDIIALYGIDYSFVLAKELTKNFEHFLHAPGVEVQKWLLEDQNHSKGEFVLILPPKEVAKEKAMTLKQTLTILLAELPLKQAVKVGSLLSQTSKNDLYKIALQIKESEK